MRLIGSPEQNKDIKVEEGLFGKKKGVSRNGRGQEGDWGEFNQNS